MTVKEMFRRASAKGVFYAWKVVISQTTVVEKHYVNIVKVVTITFSIQINHLKKNHPQKRLDPLSLHLQASQEEVPKEATSNVTASSVGTNEFGKVILQTVPAVLCGSNGNSMVVRCFLDSGSQTSFIKQNVIEQLGLDGPSVRISVSGFGGKQDKACLRKRVSCTLAPVDRPRCSREFEALTTSEICHPAEAVEINPAIYSHLKDVKFPEEFPREQKPIDVLIGLDFYYSFVTRDVVKAEPSEPVAVRTVLGWV